MILSVLVVGALLLLQGPLLLLLLRRVRGKWFESKGVRIHYTDQGTGEPVILVHGYTANADVNWRLPLVIARLRRRFRVVAMDVRGHGLSGKPHDARQYGIETVNDVLRLMNHLGIQKAHLVGYSMGGFITLKFLTLYPERLISAMPCGAAWMTPSDPLCSLLTDIHAGLIRKDAPTSGPLAVAARAHRRLLGTFLDLEALGCVGEGFRQLAVTEEELRAAATPVMAIRAGRDVIVRGGGDIGSVLPGYRELIIPGAGHNSVIFCRRFGKTISMFLLEHTQAIR